jgi:hypothetical protein
MGEIGTNSIDGPAEIREPWITIGFIQAVLCILGYYAMFFLPWDNTNMNPFTFSGSTLYDLVSFGNHLGFQIGSFLLFVGLGICLFHRRTFAIGWVMVLVAMAVISLSFLTNDLRGTYFGLGVYAEWAIALGLFATMEKFRMAIFKEHGSARDSTKR